MTTKPLTVKANLQGMLSDAIALRRPASEIDQIRRELARYEPQSIAAVRTMQAAFIRLVGSAV